MDEITPKEDCDNKSYKEIEEPFAKAQKEVYKIIEKKKEEFYK